MTLLEAMVQGKSIVATNIVGNRSVLENRWGMLVENSVDGLVEGMRRYLDGQEMTGVFDWQSYNQVAIDQFQRNVLGTPP